MYGTLRKGSPKKYAHELAASARFIGHGRIRGRLFRVAHYPALAAPASPADWVKGDLFENVSDELLQRLDEYEGSEYTRVVAEISMDDRQGVAAYLYCYVMPVDELELIPSGDWFDVTGLPSLPE